MFSSILNLFSINPLLGLILLAFVVFLAWNLTLHWQIYQLRQKIKMLFNGSKITDLEGVIFEQIKRLRQNEKNLKELRSFCEYLEEMALKSIQKVGVVRFNPFKDTGGDQSFSVAVLDAQNNGFLLSSLFTRESSRVYTKPITDSQSTYPLTEEEKEAIKLATSAKKKKRPNAKIKNQSVK